MRSLETANCPPSGKRKPTAWPLIIHRQSNIQDGRAQIAEVMGRAIFFPQYSMRPVGHRREDRVPAPARNADGLTAFIDPESDSDGVAGERLKFPICPGPGPQITAS